MGWSHFLRLMDPSIKTGSPLMFHAVNKSFERKHQMVRYDLRCRHTACKGTGNLNGIFGVRNT